MSEYKNIEGMENLSEEQAEQVVGGYSAVVTNGTYFDTTAETTIDIDGSTEDANYVYADASTRLGKTTSMVNVMTTVTATKCPTSCSTGSTM